MSMHVLKPFVQQLLMRHEYHSRGNGIFDWAGTDVMVHLPSLDDHQSETKVTTDLVIWSFFWEPASWGFLGGNLSGRLYHIPKKALALPR